MEPGKPTSPPPAGFRGGGRQGGSVPVILPGQAALPAVLCSESTQGVSE